jgi:hypothetical protein
MDVEINKASKKENLDTLSDPLDIVKLNKEYKEKSKKLFEKKLKELDSSIDIENNETQKPLGSKLGDFITKILPENTQNVAQEQSTFTPKEEFITLSEKTITDIGELLKLNLKEIEENTAKKQMAEEESGGGLLSTIGKLLALGGVAGILISAFWDDYIKPWLEEKFDVNLDFLDKFEGLVEGIGKFFTLGGLKITAGPLFTLVGKAFTTFGDLLEGGLKSIFQLGFGDDVVKAGTKAAPAAWKTLLPKIAGGLFKGVGITFLKGIPVIGSLISFYFAYDRYQKADYVGAVIDLVGGLADLLYFTPLAPLALPISLGAAALNAFLDYKTGGLPENQRQGAKLNIIGDLAGRVYDMLKDVPFIGGLMKFGLGIYELASGNFDKALDYLTEQPFLGPFPALIKSLMDARVEQPDGSKTFSFDTFQNEMKKNMFKFMLSLIPPSPFDFGLRGMLAKTMGLEYNDSTGDIQISGDPANLASINQAEMQRVLESRKKFESLKPEEIAGNKDLEEELNDMYALSVENVKKAEEEAKRSNFSIKDTVSRMLQFGSIAGLAGSIGSYFSDKEMKDMRVQGARQDVIEINNLRSDVNKIKGYLNEDGQMDGSKTSSQLKRKLQFSPEVKDDFEFNSDFSRAVLFDNKTKTANIMSPDDNLLAYKTDGIFDRSLKEMTSLMDSINKGISKMSISLETTKTMQSPSISIASQSNSSGYKDVVFSGSRDSIYDLRNNWWRTTSSIRDSA